MQSITTPQPVSRDKALEIARLDAEKAYRDLTPYRVEIRLEDDGWHVDYHLLKTESQGGGPHYIIDSVTGTIKQKRYEQ